MPRTQITKERATVTLDAELLEEARRRGIIISRACEAGLRSAIEEARKEDSHQSAGDSQHSGGDSQHSGGDSQHSGGDSQHSDGDSHQSADDSHQSADDSHQCS